MNEIRILHVNSLDIKGGAARAAYRLHTSLKASGIDSRMLVQSRFSSEPGILGPGNKILEGMATMRQTFDKLPLKAYRERQQLTFSPQWLPDRILPRIKQFNPDIIHLHWINQGFIQIETLKKLNRPIVWTLHDMWPFTGGCHYSGDCLKYEKTCGACPQLTSDNPKDLSHQIWKRKAKSWRSLNLTVVAPSQWMADCAAASSLFRQYLIQVIPHGLDLEVYKPTDKQTARSLLGLPIDARIILFGSANGTSEKRKGFHLLIESLQQLSHLKNSGSQIHLAIFGQSSPVQEIDFGFETHYLGTFQDDLSLSLAYSAADVMVVPSTHESFGLTALEALASGTPVVAYAATGLLDVLAHKQSGFLANPFDINDFAHGISWVIEDAERYRFISSNARKEAIDNFSIELHSRRHLSLYESLLA